MNQALNDALDELVLANHILAHEGVLDGFGHVSIRAPDDPATYFISRARAPELVEPDDLIRFTLDSAPVGTPKGDFYSERVIHGEIYKARPDVNAICHNHAASVMPFCISETPLKPVFHLGGAALGEKVRYWDSRDEFGETNLLVAKPEEGQSLARALDKDFVVLMRRHGATVVGGGPREVVFRSIYMAVNAKMQLEAAQLGSYQTLSIEEVRLATTFNIRPYSTNRAWERWAMHAKRRS
jgi:HCOMODA/2-hydroxy-3-carboxy-muconic semialdehyde decarboxylase